MKAAVGRQKNTGFSQHDSKVLPSRPDSLKLVGNRVLRLEDTVMKIGGDFAGAEIERAKHTRVIGDMGKRT